MPSGPVGFVQVDSFTCKPFGGNPAAVFLLEDDFPADEWMQMVAREMNLSETAFTVPGPSAEEYNLRWFTPTNEVDLCGHATLAAAHAIFQHLKAHQEGPEEADIPDELRFNTRSGELIVKKGLLPGQEDLLYMAFPALPATELPEEMYAQVQSAIGSKQRPLWVGRNALEDLLVEVELEQEVAHYQPDLSRVASLGGRGMMVTARAENSASYDFVSRFWGPNVGIAEDPVTGSAHCALGPYWASKMKKNSFRAYQCSERGGHLEVTVDDAMDRVVIGGYAITTIQGTLLC